ncbi:LuxR C-terminal-related transcriptional regulator [Oxalobacter aliiformigenes]|nr:LuxR C-terminal-related transcriptional regulator [Oxalobacter aliiformigenes]WAW00382.1 LuxR C-terminal-related transcriptional regulator [Oxalobacter aliiformigenes]
MARELGIHFQTVMKHRENLYRRLGIKNALSLALLVSGGHMG